jgi:hypothetical protein
VPLLVAAAILVLGAGVAAAIVLTGDGDEGTTTTVSAASSAEPTDDEEQADTVDDGLTPSGVPAVGRPAMETEIETLLRTFHEDVVAGDYRSAWALLTSRKRQQNLAESGYREWQKAQETLSGDLSPAGLQVRIEALEGDGVARVSLTGMGWSDPSSSCAEWSGLTWVRFEQGGWAYDPGYSTTGARRQAWEQRAGELLGTGC